MKRVLALTLAAVATAFCTKPEVEDVAATGPLTVQVDTAKLEVLQTAITVTGTVAPAPGADWTINAPESGRVIELPKAEGDAVKPGDLLVKFEIPSMTSTILASQSEILQSNARLTAAKASVTRLTGLVERGIAPQRDLDEAQRELQEAQAAMRIAEGNKDVADQLAARTIVRARFAGVIARRWHNPGDIVDGSAADPVLRVIDPARLEITAALPAAELALITPGQPAKIFNPADGRELAGSVINRQLLSDTTTPTGEVRVSFGTTSSARGSAVSAVGATAPSVLVGSPIQVEITGDSRTSVLVVPRAAVFREGDVIFVVVAGDDGKAHHRNVQTGIMTRDKAQILSGLMAGEKVILSGADAVANGTAITIGRSRQ